ncbi:hypothetical protein, partial [Enterococcus faecium]|uniref:hypothetical protein n=1 Tax=Enterococcus faecium TaxID=1352 RepID=UPI002658A566
LVGKKRGKKGSGGKIEKLIEKKLWKNMKKYCCVIWSEKEERGEKKRKRRRERRKEREEERGEGGEGM